MLWKYLAFYKMSLPESSFRRYCCSKKQTFSRTLLYRSKGEHSMATYSEQENTDDYLSDLNDETLVI